MLFDAALHVRQVCRPGHAEACAYLCCGPDGFECGKQDPALRQEIDRRRAAGSMNATRDNCPGHPL